MKPPLAVFGAAVVVSALLIAGCGGDNSASVSNTATTAASAGTTAKSGSGSSSATSSDSGSGTTSPTFTGDKNSDFCKAANDLNQMQESGDFQTDLQKVRDAFNDLAAKAPNDIKSDVKTLSDKLQSLVASGAQNEEALQAALSDPQFSTALTRIGSYIDQVCGLSETSTTT